MYTGDRKANFSSCPNLAVGGPLLQSIDARERDAVLLISKRLAHVGGFLPPLLTATRKNFNVSEVSADMGYISEDNLQAVTDAGAKPLIPFKSNATGGKGGLWEKMFHYFSFNKEEFFGRYHLRSNVESTFSMLKAKFGDSVRSKTDVAMKNEVLAKVVCHNVCCLISAIYELGIDPVFWAELPVAQQVGQN